MGNVKITYRKDKNSYTGHSSSGNTYTYSDNKYDGYAKQMAQYSAENDCKIQNWFEDCGDYVKIFISNKDTHNAELLVDKEDYDKVKNYHWHLTDNKDYNNSYYARTNDTNPNAKKKQPRCHEIVLGHYENDGMEIDHVNGNGLDNRKNNLRLVTHRANSTNRTCILSSNTSGINGVRYNPDGPRWTAFWCDKNTGKVKTKSYSVKVYGDKAAKQMAIEYRNRMEKENDYLE